MCCGEQKGASAAPFEVDNPRSEPLGEGHNFLADLYNAEPGYDTFGFVFDVTWSDGSVNQIKGVMWLDSWSSPKYTYHAVLGAKDASGSVLGVKALAVRPDFAMSKDGKTWGNLGGLKEHLLAKELYLRQGRA